jgi:hypothetical protein
MVKRLARLEFAAMTEVNKMGAVCATVVTEKTNSGLWDPAWAAEAVKNVSWFAPSLEYTFSFPTILARLVSPIDFLFTLTLL